MRTKTALWTLILFLTIVGCSQPVVERQILREVIVEVTREVSVEVTRQVVVTATPSPTPSPTVTPWSFGPMTVAQWATEFVAADDIMADAEETILHLMESVKPMGVSRFGDPAWIASFAAQIVRMQDVKDRLVALDTPEKCKEVEGLYLTGVRKSILACRCFLNGALENDPDLWEEASKHAEESVAKRERAWYLFEMGFPEFARE